MRSSSAERSPVPFYVPSRDAQVERQWQEDGEKVARMSFTGVRSLDQSIAKTNAWLAETASEFGSEDRQFAYRVTQARRAVPA